MKKIKIYITFKQALIILIPMILLLMVFFDSNLVVGDLKRFLSFKGENLRISKEALFQSVLSNKNKIDLYGKNFFETNKDSTIWLLKYGIYKKAEKKEEGGNLAKYVALTKSSNDADSMLKHLNEKSLEKMDRETLFKNLEKKFEKEIIKEEIKVQNLKLQMILISKRKSKVIINGEILTIGNKIGEAKVIKIAKDRVLVKTPKESKWLKLIN